MPEQYLNRSSALGPDQVNRPGSNTIRVHSTTDKLKFGTGTSGSTEAEVVDRSSAPLAPVTIAGDGAITVQNSVVSLTKGSAAVITLAAPTAAQEGIQIAIVAQSAFAHVVTATGLIDDGVTGGSKNTWTSAAFVGSSLTLVALNLKWSVLSKNLGTIA